MGSVIGALAVPLTHLPMPHPMEATVIAQPILAHSQLQARQQRVPPVVLVPIPAAKATLV